MKTEGMRDEEAERVDLRMRTKQFALRVIRLFCALPKRVEANVIGKQVLRSATAVGANSREAHCARSDAEFVAKLGDCLKELEEPCYWLELLVEAEILPADRLVQLQDECNQPIAILTTTSKKVKCRAKWRFFFHPSSLQVRMRDEG